jgi:XTP/dITP diphosphohydrolase
MKTLLLGTTNAGKINEFLEVLKPLKLNLVTPLSLNTSFDVEETGDSFEENALMKAKAWAKNTKLATLVDDSGLSIDALDGKPGVHSRRFHPGSDKDRNLKILELLKNTPEEKRTARYIAVVAFFDPLKNLEHITKGVCEGKINQGISGTNGFGYDPIFIPKGYTQTFGILPQKIKNSISHRSQALAKMYSFLEQWKAI